MWDVPENKVQGVQENLCFSTIHYYPSPAYIGAVRDLQSFQRNAGVQLLLLYACDRAQELCTADCHWLATNGNPVVAREGREITEESFQKKVQYFELFV